MAITGDGITLRTGYGFQRKVEGRRAFAASRSNAGLARDLQITFSKITL